MILPELFRKGSEPTTTNPSKGDNEKFKILRSPAHSYRMCGRVRTVASVELRPEARGGASRYRSLCDSNVHRVHQACLCTSKPLWAPCVKGYPNLEMAVRNGRHVEVRIPVLFVLHRYRKLARRGS